MSTLHTGVGRLLMATLSALMMLSFFGVAWADGVQTFHGALEERGWMMSRESYCHGGSRYFVLKTASDTITVGSARTQARAPSHQRFYQALAACAGKVADLTAVQRTEVYSYDEHCPGETAVCMGGELRCSWLELLEVPRCGN